MKEPYIVLILELQFFGRKTDFLSRIISFQIHLTFLQFSRRLFNSKITVPVNTEQERGDRPSDYARREDGSPLLSKYTRSAKFGMFYFRFTCKDQPENYGWRYPGKEGLEICHSAWVYDVIYIEWCVSHLFQQLKMILYNQKRVFTKNALTFHQ